MKLFHKRKKAGAVDMSRLPRHIAVIMDGNGRWASKRGLPRTAGHAAGAEEGDGENIRGQGIRRNSRADVLIQGRNSVRAPVGDTHVIQDRIPDKQQSATDFVDVIKVVIQVRRKGATDLAKPPIRSRSGLGTGNIDLEGSDKGCICIEQSPGKMVEMSFARNRNDRI